MCFPKNCKLFRSSYYIEHYKQLLPMVPSVKQVQIQIMWIQVNIEIKFFYSIYSFCTAVSFFIIVLYKCLQIAHNLLPPGIKGFKKRFKRIHLGKPEKGMMVLTHFSESSLWKLHFQLFLFWVSWNIKKKQKLYGLFLWMGFNCFKARTALRRWFTFYH